MGGKVKKWKEGGKHVKQKKGIPGILSTLDDTCKNSKGDKDFFKAISK